MRRILLSVAFLLACSGAAYAQDSEFSGGGGTAGAITAGVGSGNAGRVPQFASTTSLVDSKMLTSGTNSGTWTLYDSTASTGASQLFVRTGPGQSTTNQLLIGSTSTGLFESAAGILKVTDGSTGSGGIGISDAATATVTDALILRHATSNTADIGFGTGLLFQAENDAGTMHTIGGIDAVWVDDADTTEDSELKFYAMEAGAKVLVATMSANDGSLASRALSFNGLGGVEAGSTLTIESGSGSNIRFGTSGVAQRWLINGTTGHWEPAADNTYDIGTSSASVREGFFNTITAPSNLVLGAGNTDQIVMGSTYFGTTGSAVNTLNLGYAGAEFASAYVTTSIQGTRSKVLTEGGATGFVDISVASGEGTGGYVEYTVETTDGTDRTIETGMLYFSGINLNGGTVDDSDVGIVGTPVQSTSAANTFVNTFSVTSGTDKITVNCSSATTLAGTDVITIRYRVVVNRGTATVTPIA